MMTVAELLNKKVQKDAYTSEDVWPRTDKNVDSSEVQSGLLSLEHLGVTG